MAPRPEDLSAETILARLADLVADAESLTYTAHETAPTNRAAVLLGGDIVTKGHVEGRSVWPVSLTYLRRRWRARNWTCRCGARVFAESTGCERHGSVRSQVLSGKITRAEDARTTTDET